MNTNQILKSMIMGIYKNNRDSFRKRLHVNIENCEPINVKGQKYDPKTQGENYFYFLNKDFRLLTVLQGSKFLKEEYDNYLYIEDYFDKTGKNRKNIEPKSEYILMITPEMRKKYKSHNYYRRENTSKEKLMQRLKEYKTRKNEQYSHEDIKNKISEIMLFLTSNIFQDSEYVNKYFNKLHLFTRTMPKIINNFSDDIDNLLYNYNEYQNEILRYEKFKNDKDSDYSENWNPKYSHNYINYLKYKDLILDWEKLIKNIK